jgi:hypothetical protein
MMLIQKNLIAHYVVTGVVLGVLGFYSFKLHQYSKYDKQLVQAIQSLQDGGTTGYDEAFKNNIERQFSPTQPEEVNWITAFKKDSLLYPQNLITYSFRTMPAFGLVLEKMTLSDDTVFCLLRVRDREQFNVTAKFIRKGNIFLLDNLENIAAFYKRLNCYNLYLMGSAKTQNQK